MSEAGDVWRSKCGRMELRCGRWQVVLADVERVDAVITDPPYSPRQAEGFVSGSSVRIDGNKRPPDKARGGSITYVSGMPYAPMSADMCREFAEHWTDIAQNWVVAFGDHVSFRWWEGALMDVGWYVFAPVGWVRTGSTPRFQGDGPSCSVEHICVSRPRRKTRCGSLPGHYIHQQVGGGDRNKIVTGQKPVRLMAAIVKDYSRKGDLICDPCAGGGTTLLAAAIEGRRAIGAEMDPDTFDKAVRRLSAGYTPRLFA